MKGYQSLIASAHKSFNTVTAMPTLKSYKSQKNIGPRSESEESAKGSISERLRSESEEPK